MIAITIVAALIALNGLFVAAEFAIVGVSQAELEPAERRGHRVARHVRALLRDPRQQDRFIATAQLGITAASLGLGMYGEHVLAQSIASQLEGLGWERWIAAHTVASVVAVALLTYLHIVLGEMIPKSLALQHARSTVLRIAPIMSVLQRAAYPLIVLLNGIGNGLLRVIGIDRAVRTPEQYSTAEEIGFLVRESQAGGLLRKESADVLNELLQFSNRTAREVMTPRVNVVGMPFDAPPAMMRALVQTTPHTRYPVYQRSMDQIVGMLHVRDVLRLGKAEAPLVPAQLREIPFVPETARMDHVLATMRQARTQMAVVMDELGGTAGILTLEDLFEEVVGDITDRADEVPDVQSAGADRVRASGSARVDSVGVALGVGLEHEEVDTISGLILALLGRPPVVGDVVVYDGVRFEVTAVRGHGVATCLAALLAPPRPPSRR